jgi:hypothetical protein
MPNVATQLGRRGMIRIDTPSRRFGQGVRLFGMNLNNLYYCRCLELFQIIMKNPLLNVLIVLFMMPASTYGQTGLSKIVGVVSDSSGAPVIYASVSIKDVNKGTTTDFNGNFTISGLTAGSYQMNISAVGYETQTRMIDLSADAVEQVTVSLKTTPLLLNEIIVTSRRGDERRT